MQWPGLMTLLFSFPWAIDSDVIAAFLVLFFDTFS